MITKDFLYCQYTVKDKEELFDRLTADLMAKDIVREGFSQALKDREAEFPTGLPVKHGVAIPHTDGSLVNSDQLLFVTLTEPIVFNEMGGDDEDTIEVNVVVMLAVKDGKKHLTVLQNLIEAIQKEGFVNQLVDSTDEEQILAAVNAFL
ncbi:PTS sugar transporter subunit IIA [Enterococcus sp. AZ072]|uniref:PTS sugar transporter subunit IIA n=1 Tax=unclassified Enterococcus TaxID=2608891 RepID=UPI003D2C6E76